VNLVHVVESGRQPRMEAHDPMPRHLTYTQIADDLTARIAAGEYDEDDGKLPSYAELADLYSVSVATAQRAILILRTRGTVVGIPGRGVFVTERPTE
jgi:GntR family transcriptional regulator